MSNAESVSLWRARRIPLGLCLTLATGALSSVTLGDARGDSPSMERMPAAPGAEERSAALPPLPPEYVSEDEGGWLHLGYHPSARERLRVVMPRIAEMREELRTTLGSDVLEEVEIRIAALDAEMVRLTPHEAAPPANGEAFTAQHLIVLTAGTKPGSDAQDLELSIRYHLARLALAEAVSKSSEHAPSTAPTTAPSARPAVESGSTPNPDPRELHPSTGGGGGARSGPETNHTPAAGLPEVNVPAWFEEGFATHFAHSREATRSESLMLAALRGDLPHLKDLERPDGDDQSAFAADFVRFVSETNDGATMPLLMEKLRDGSDLDQAVASALGSDWASVDRAWRRDMGRRYGLFPVLALSLVLWAALWLVGLVRRRRAALATEATRARLRTLRRAQALDADGIATAKSKRDGGAPPRRSGDNARQHDAVYANQHAPLGGSSEPATTSRNVGSQRAGSQKSTSKEIPVEVPRVEHDGAFYTLH